MNILFVCEANRQRSPTAERLINRSRKNKAKSCGIWKHAEVPINRRLIDWADIIFTMDIFQKMFVKEKFKCNKEIINLMIPDDFQRNDPELIEELKKKLKEYL